MSERVVNFTGSTILPIPVERILTNKDALALTEVIVLGWNEDGSIYLAMSDPGLDRALMLLAIAQQQIVSSRAADASPF
jgi:hypothetical protein